MEAIEAIILFLVLTIIGVAYSRNRVDSATLQDWANIVTVSSGISLIIVGAIFGILFLVNHAQLPPAQPTDTPTVNMPTGTFAPTASMTPLSPTPSDEKQQKKLVDDYFICIDDPNSDLQNCWNKLSEEYQTQYNSDNSGQGLETFISKWKGYYLTYTLYYCQEVSGTYYVEAIYNKYASSDLSTITTANIGAFFYFGRNDKGWYIKKIIFSPVVTELSSDCWQAPIIEKLTPTP